ncbi:uncharacterized protein SCHCODRAFT_02502972 [Schizophyllum commune H4-8]|nr:uncharacterized protein SCHCODRAFT_02502972 [Schizophyllum commune H4-8]KAI5892005.1 hypothetical protein SCHCODRAFT_02502972 [Schizophyllum commune H4-8]
MDELASAYDERLLEVITILLWNTRLRMSPCSSHRSALSGGLRVLNPAFPSLSPAAEPDDIDDRSTLTPTSKLPTHQHRTGVMIAGFDIPLRHRTFVFATNLADSRDECIICSTTPKIGPRSYTNNIGETTSLTHTPGAAGRDIHLRRADKLLHTVEEWSSALMKLDGIRAVNVGNMSLVYVLSTVLRAYPQALLSAAFLDGPKH